MTRMLDPVLGPQRRGRLPRRRAANSATRTGLAKLAGNLEEVLRIVDLSVSENKPLDHATASALVLAAPDCGEEITPAVAAAVHVFADPCRS